MLCERSVSCDADCSNSLSTAYLTATYSKCPLDENGLAYWLCLIADCVADDVAAAAAEKWPGCRWRCWCDPASVCSRVCDSDRLADYLTKPLEQSEYDIMGR